MNSITKIAESQKINLEAEYYCYIAGVPGGFVKNGLEVAKTIYEYAEYNFHVFDNYEQTPEVFATCVNHVVENVVSWELKSDEDRLSYEAQRYHENEINEMIGLNAAA